jgi:hypothetical protein
MASSDLRYKLHAEMSDPLRTSYFFRLAVLRAVFFAGFRLAAFLAGFFLAAFLAGFRFATFLAGFRTARFFVAGILCDGK